MRHKTVVITGATSGIGEVAALRLAEQGARIVFVARDRARAEITLAALRKANNAADHRFIVADLSLLSDMKRAAGEVADLAPAIDVLINNAGALFNRRIETADGLEKTFALNHMAYFVVTRLLIPNIADGGRVVNVSSRAHRNATLDFDDLQSRRAYSGFPVYSKSKLCNILFTRELARRLPRGITANALHPGFVATRFGDESGRVMQRLVSLAKSLAAITPEEGAKTIIYLASSPEIKGVNGMYFFKCRPVTPSVMAQDVRNREILWSRSRLLAGMSEAISTRRFDAPARTNTQFPDEFRQRLIASGTKLNPPATEEQIDQLKRLLGPGLHPYFISMYRSFNGCYGGFPLADSAIAISPIEKLLELASSSSDLFHEGYFPVADWGIDCQFYVVPAMDPASPVLADNRKDVVSDSFYDFWDDLFAGQID